MVEDCSDVVGVTEPARSDEASQERIDIVVVGFGTAKFDRERAEGIGLDGALGLFVGESGAADESGPAVVLSRGGELTD